MTITTEPAALSYSGDDSTVAFPITWKYFATTDVVATLRSAAGVETTWVLNTDYTLSAAGVDTGGTLTATTAPASGTTLVITLDPPNTQDASLPRGGAFPSSTVEDALDQAAQRDAKLEILWERALRVPKTDLRTGTSLEIPIDTLRASKYLHFDGNGVPTAADGTATLGETGLLSQDTESELTIASGSITPTVATHSIDTESDAATDNLDTIVTTNLENGRLLLIRGENASRVVTIRHEQGGAGQIHTASGSNVTLLGSTANYLLLQRRGTDWYEVQLRLSAITGINSSADAVILTLTSDEQALVGHTAAITGPAGLIPRVQVVGTTAVSQGSLLLGLWNTTAANCANLEFIRSKNATAGSNTIVAAEDLLGSIRWGGDDGVDFQASAALIRAVVDGTPGVGDMPGRLEFLTTADGAESPTLALTINALQESVYSGLIRKTITNSITAGTTQTQAGATALTTDINRVTVIGTNGDGVKLPTAASGKEILIINDDAAQTLQIWPASGDKIDGGSADAVDSSQLAAGASRRYIAVDATDWYTA